LTYLNKTSDILEHGATANFPYAMQWESGAYPGSWHQVPNDNEISSSTEILFSRILCATGMMSSTRGHISALRNSISQNNSHQAKECIGGFQERILFAAVRLYK